MNVAILVLVACATLVLFLGPLRNQPLWRATITPLASIIGSGFLVLGPVLAHDFGSWAPVGMAALCLLAWSFGSAIRANIARIDTEEGSAGEWSERISAWVLSVAYMISVAYYLNLLGSFAVSLTSFDTPLVARATTTAVYLFIILLGWTRGFGALEAVEYPAVVVKLAVITGLIFALGHNMWSVHQQDSLVFPVADIRGWYAVTLFFGLIVTVQGFETSRYLGVTYSASVRIKSMKIAQYVSTVIYLVYVVLLTYAVPISTDNVSETEIIHLMKSVAPILPVLLLVAALAAQFSAAVADTGGAGGLVEEVTHKRVSERQGYLLVCLVGLVLTWLADVFTIIAFASRAFALYYGVQSFIAARNSLGGYRIFYGALTVVGFAAALLGAPVEG
ncbi:MAG: hypothetical protein VB958_04510 [Thalassolituus sp.]|uniref:hypothetical protein n=1 Tax=Thalassolituus sp. TaxID=2030822 RepID=UPI003981A90E